MVKTVIYPPHVWSLAQGSVSIHLWKQMSYQNVNYHKVNSALDFPAALEEGRKSLSTVIDQDLDESNLNITDEEKHMLTVLGASFRKINDVDFTIFVCYS